MANFSCSCTMGFSGRDCSVDIDECQEAVCPGNSTCVDSVGNYTCACDPGFTGLNCSQGKHSYCLSLVFILVAQ